MGQGASAPVRSRIKSSPENSPPAPPGITVAHGRGSAPVGEKASRRYGPTAEIDNVVAFVLVASELVHAMQAERGSSAVFCASKGTEFGEAIHLLRAVTDEAWGKFTQAALFGTGRVRLSYSEIQVMRLRVDSVIPYLEVIKMYILLVERVLAMIGERISPLRTSPAGSTVGNFLTFQNFKEYNGRERAVVAAMLCDEEQLRNHKSYAFYLKLKGAQIALGQMFLLTASPEVANVYKKELPTVPQEVSNLNERLNFSLEAAEEALKDLTVENWFKVMSERMNMLEKVEMAILEELETCGGGTSKLIFKLRGQGKASDWEASVGATLNVRDMEHSRSGTDDHGRTYVDVESCRGTNASVRRVLFTEKIGEGMAGPIYAGDMNGQKVAIKLCQTMDERGEELPDKAEILREFVREVSVISMMHHPNVIQFVGSCLTPPRYAMVLEYLDGGTVWDLLHQSPSKVDFFSLAIQTAKGLEYIHNVPGLMHRDLKTPNLLLNKNGELKIADFGLCCLGDEGQSNQVMEVGTLRWMAPEILLHCSYDNSADIYSLGIILWEMLTKQVPFLELQQAGVLSKATMLTVAKEFLRPQFPSRTPKEIKHIINECWHPMPMRRPSITKVLHMLEDANAKAKEPDRIYLNRAHGVAGVEQYRP